MALLLAFGAVQPAQANLDTENPTVETEVGPNTEIRITSLGAGLTLTGLQPATPISQDPLAPYPAADPAGFVATSTYAGIINAVSLSDPSLVAEMYCINLRVETYIGIGYESGTWDESNVPNVDYVAYILNNYHPTTSEPSGLPVAQRAAAVQSAIWYFTDGFVVANTPANAAVRAATAAIVQDAQINGPVVEPPQPVVEVTPALATAPTDDAAGPFTVTAEGAAEVTVSVPSGFTMHDSATSTTPLPNPSTVAPGSQIWLRSETEEASAGTLSARAAVTVQRGSVYLYDGNSPDYADAQRLILADTTELDAVASAAAEFFAAGSLRIDKTFAGEAVGSQGPIQLAVDCGEAGTFAYDIAAGETEAQSFTVEDLPLGTSCTVNEPLTGETATVIATNNLPQTTAVTAEGAVVTALNTLTFQPGSLRVVKTLAGAAAGAQEAITLTVDCGEAVQETISIPAGSAAGEYAQTYSDLPAGTACVVTETASGETAEVAVEPSAPVDVEILPAATVDAVLLNSITYRPGELRVVKSITGTGAGAQDAIVLSIDCGSALNETFTIPARSSAGEYTQTFGPLPAGTACTVTETEIGSATGVQVDADGPVTVTVPAGAAIDAVLANEVTAMSAAGLASTGGQWRLDILLLGVGTVLLGVWVVARRRRIVT
ncbi:thioester domain-containing protein [Zhihengliuella sp. ISTPL4]|uniref:thioester domain-containing protein n=1 Tax=Zhihengliuella sp. ISTPL4 TaxID=2058657 RepID=UPI00130534FD|nr:thioester domain-containing protein [Zhihengliuella sp. ISTPL4]